MMQPVQKAYKRQKTFLKFIELFEWKEADWVNGISMKITGHVHEFLQIKSRRWVSRVLNECSELIFDNEWMKHVHFVTHLNPISPLIGCYPVKVVQSTRKENIGRRGFANILWDLHSFIFFD